MTLRPLDQLGPYAVAVLDPPWPLARFGPQKAEDFGFEYDTMSLEEIAALPVARVLADDARVFLWTGNHHLPYAFELLRTWELDYNFVMAWVKSGGVKSPTSPMFNAEWVVVGKRGRPSFRDTRQFFTANAWPRAGHSVKPEGFYDLLRRVTPGPRLDIFGRRRIAGFDSWGLEAPAGPATPDEYQEVLDF